MSNQKLAATLLAAISLAASLRAAPTLIATGSLSGTASDLSGLTGLMENGVAGNLLGGMGSGLAWAGGNTFLALPDRGPNATAYTAGTSIDNTTSWISRFQTITLGLNAPTTVVSGATGGTGLGTLTPTLTGTTLLYSPTELNYSPTVINDIAGTPTINTVGKNYFSGRSDNYLAGSNSTNSNNGRLDPEALRVSNDGSKVYMTDEYGPYVYQFDRATGARTNTYTLPDAFTAAKLSSAGATEISGNTAGRVANKGMEGLAITPNGQFIVGFEQSPLIQDGGDGGRANRIVKIDTTTGATKQYVYDNFITSANKTFNSSEILAINDHEFLVLERDGKGLGDGSNAAIKQIYKIDLNGATDIGALNDGAGITGEADLLTYAVNKTLFLDLKLEMNNKGITNANIPAKLEGMAWGEDVTINGFNYHILYVGNDNDFTGVAGDNKIFAFAVSDDDLGGSVFANQTFTSAIPEPSTYAALAGVGALGLALYRRRSARR
jgi:hypothetical protein